MVKDMPPKGNMSERLVKLHRIAGCSAFWSENREMRALARTIQDELEIEISDLIREYEVAGSGEVTRELVDRLLERLTKDYEHIIGATMREMLERGELKLGQNFRLSLNPEWRKQNG